MSAGPLLTVERLTAFKRRDLEELCEAATEAIGSGGGFGWLKAPPRHLFESYWKGVLLVPERQVFIGRIDGTIAGSAQLIRPGRNNEAQAHSATLATSFVAPWARGHGLGRRLVQAVEAAAVEADLSLINLDIRETQTAAISLVESLGYKRWGEHPHYARVDGAFVRGFYYSKRLGPARADSMPVDHELSRRAVESTREARTALAPGELGGETT